MEERTLELDADVSIKILLILALVSLVVINVGNIKDLKEAEHEKKVFGLLLKSELDYSEIIDEGSYYYDQASYYYELGNYDKVEEYASLAQGKYHLTILEFREIKAELVKNKELDPLIDKFVQVADEWIKIYENMYEASEYFEVVGRNYNIYYEKGVYDDVSYETATSNLEAMNEKIKAHDDAVRRLNDLVSSNAIELKERIENSG